MDGEMVWNALDPTRAYGTPSIRFDRSLPPLKSIANAQNWGDEHDGKG
jgi:predicted alpha-1,6-mannanase (GH76 family)